MARTALVTGGAGFIGLRIARTLLARGAEVTLLDDFSRGRRDEELEDLLPSVRLVEHDLTLPIPEGAMGTPFDDVFHLAAVVGVAASMTDPMRVLRVNLTTTLNLLEWCSRRPPGSFFFSSTSEVNDGGARLGLAPFPIPESIPMVIVDPGEPRFSYAMSKMAGEMLCLNQARQSGFKVRIGRFHNVYGPRMGHDHVIPQFIDRMLDGTEPFQIYGDKQRRAFCHVDDAVRAIMMVMALEKPSELTVNIGNDRDEIEIGDLAQLLFRIAGVKRSVDAVAPPPGSPDRRLPNLSRLRELTGYEPEIGLERGLEGTLRWYRSRRSEVGC